MNSNSYFNGRSLVAVGWGATEFGQSPNYGPKILQKASLKVIDFQTCKSKVDYMNDNLKICTYANQVSDTCQV